MANIVQDLIARLSGRLEKRRATFAISIFWNSKLNGQHFDKTFVIGEKSANAMCPECERWRMAGREIGRKLGVAQERARLEKIFNMYSSVALSRCSINESNVWREATRAIRDEVKK